MNLNKNMGKKKIGNILATKVCMLYELSETILLFRLRYSMLTYFSSYTGTYSLMVNFVYTLSKVKLPPGPGRQVFFLTLNKLEFLQVVYRITR